MPLTATVLFAGVLALTGAPRPATGATGATGGDGTTAADGSVYEIHPWLDGAIIAVGGTVSLGLYGFGGGLIHPSCPCDAQDVNRFDRLAIGNHSDTAYTVATVTVGLSMAVPVVLDIVTVRQVRPVLEDAVVLTESLSVSAGLFTMAKYAVQRPFPRTYAGQPDLVGSTRGYRSFYSGHTATTFTALGVASMTIGRRHGVWALPWIATVLVGASVAAELVLAGWHFPTDVITGAALGTATGVIVPVLHFRELPVRPLLGVTPDRQGPMLSVVGTWR